MCSVEFNRAIATVVIMSSYIVACCLVLVSLAATERVGVYREIYPPLNDNDSLAPLHYYNRNCTPEDTCPLFFTFLISFGGLYTSNGGLPGVQVALDEINNDSSILPGYTLHYSLHDSNVSVNLHAYT